MIAAAPTSRPLALRGADGLPAPVSGQRHEIASPVGRLTYYSATPEGGSQLPPLLLIHSINAAGRIEFFEDRDPITPDAEPNRSRQTAKTAADHHRMRLVIATASHCRQAEGRIKHAGTVTTY